MATIHSATNPTQCVPIKFDTLHGLAICSTCNTPLNVHTKETVYKHYSNGPCALNATDNLSASNIKALAKKQEINCAEYISLKSGSSNPIPNNLAARNIPTRFEDGLTKYLRSDVLQVVHGYVCIFKTSGATCCGFVSTVENETETHARKTHLLERGQAKANRVKLPAQSYWPTDAKKLHRSCFLIYGQSDVPNTIKLLGDEESIVLPHDIACTNVRPTAQPHARQTDKEVDNRPTLSPPRDWTRNSGQLHDLEIPNNEKYSIPDTVPQFFQLTGNNEPTGPIDQVPNSEDDDEKFALARMSENHYNRLKESTIVRNLVSKDDNSGWLQHIGATQHLEGIQHYWVRRSYGYAIHDGSELIPSHDSPNRLDWEVDHLATLARIDVLNAVEELRKRGLTYQRASVIAGRHVDKTEEKKRPLDLELDHASCRDYAHAWAQALAYAWRIFRSKETMFGPEYDAASFPQGPHMTTLSDSQRAAANELNVLIDEFASNPAEAEQRSRPYLRRFALELFKQQIGSATLRNCILSYINMLAVSFPNGYLRKAQMAGLDKRTGTETPQNRSHSYDPILHTEWKAARNFTKNLSALLYVGRLYVTLDTMDRIPDTEVMSSLRETYDTSFGRYTETPVGHMINWRSYIGRVADTYQGGIAVWVQKDTALLYQGVEIALSDITAVIGRQFYEAKRTLDDMLLFGRDIPRMDSKHITDDLALIRPGATWTSVPGNRDILHVDGELDHSMLLYRLVKKTPKLQQRFLVDGRWTTTTDLSHQTDAHKDYEASVQKFLDHLLVAIHLSAGSPLRGPEILSIRWANNGKWCPRNIYVLNERVYIVSTYSKNNRRSGVKHTVHVLPYLLGNILLDYMAYVQPFRLWLLQTLRGRQRHELHSMLFASLHHHPYTNPSHNAQSTQRLTNQLKAACRLSGVTEMNTATYRHISSAVIKHKLLTTSRHHKRRRLNGSRQEVIPGTTKEGYDASTDDDTGDDFQSDADDEEDTPEGVDPRFDSLIAGFAQQSNHSVATLENSYAGQFGLAGTGLVSQEIASLRWNEYFRINKELRRVSDKNFHIEAEQSIQRGPRQEATIKTFELDSLKQRLEILVGKGTTFHKDGQRKAIRAIATNKKTTDQLIFIAGTGHGKTMVYLVPASMPTAGTTIVVLPLVVLRSQLRNTCEKYRIPFRQWTPVDDVSEQTVNIVAVAAENVCSSKFDIFVKTLIAKGSLDRIVIDECHLLLTDANFRQKFFDVGTKLRQYRAQTVWITATLPPSIELTFIKQMNLESPRLIRLDTNRANIEYSVEERVGNVDFRSWVSQRVQAIWQQLTITHDVMDSTAKAIVFCRSVDDAKRMALLLGAASYHSGSENGDETQKNIIIQQWLQTPEQTYIVATSALGLGFDYDNIRLVVHVKQPHSLIDFHQQSGRAGRNKQLSKSVVFLASTEVKALHKQGAEQHIREEQWLHKDADAMRQYISNTQCLRGILSRHFNGPDDWITCFNERQNKCGVCRSNSAGLPRTSTRAIELTTRNGREAPYSLMTQSTQLHLSQQDRRGTQQHGSQVPAKRKRSSPTPRLTNMTDETSSISSSATQPTASTARTTPSSTPTADTTIQTSGGNKCRDDIRDTEQLRARYNARNEKYYQICSYCATTTPLADHSSPKHRRWQCPHKERIEVCKQKIMDDTKEIRKEQRKNRTPGIDKECWVAPKFAACYYCYQPQNICSPQKRICNDMESDVMWVVIRAVAAAWKMNQGHDLLGKTFSDETAYYAWCGEAYRPIHNPMINAHWVVAQVHDHLEKKHQ